MSFQQVSQFQVGRLSKQNRLEVESKIRKHVKYFYMSMHKNAKSRYYTKQGIKRNNRLFSICIMTDDNQFYYYEKRMLAIALSSRSYKELKKLILTPFIYDETTEVIIDEKVKRHEPFYIIYDILRSQCRFTINNLKLGRMYKMVAKYNRMFKNWSLYGPKKQYRLFKELKDQDFLSFVPDDFLMKMSLKTEVQKKLMMDSIVSMIYMYYREDYRKHNNNR